MSVYVASSWRNDYQDIIVQTLRGSGFKVYDFKNPSEGDTGFHWSEIDPEWRSWSTAQYRQGLTHPLADAGYGTDMTALDKCGACVLVLPCGKSAHLEAGWACGRGKAVFALIPSPEWPEPELMYKMFDGVTSEIYEIIKWLREVGEGEE